MSNSKDVIAGPKNTQLQKAVFFFLFFLSGYYDVNLSCTKLKPLKIDKRGKLLKVNIVSDAELLFWSDTKRDTRQKK